MFSRSNRHLLLIGLSYSLGLLAAAGAQTSQAQDRERVVRPNYQQARQYSSRYVRQFLYDTSVRPNWIGETDEFWYSFRTSAGRRYHRVDPAKNKKAALFDHVKLAAKLSELSRKPQDPTQLSLSRAEVNKEGTELKFVFDGNQYLYKLADEELEKVGKASTSSRTSSSSRFSSRSRSRSSSRSSTSTGHRVFSPDRTAYVFAKGYDLYYVEIPPGYKAPPEKKKEGDAEKKEGDAEKKDDADKKEGDADKKDDGEDKRKAVNKKRTKQNRGKTGRDKKSDGDDEQEEKNAEKGKGEDKQDGDKEDSDKKDAGKKDEKDSDKKEDKKGGDKKVADTKDGDTKDGDKKDGDKKDGDKKDGDKKDGDKKDGDKKDGDKKDDDAEDDEEKELPIPKIGPELDDKAVRLTKDGVDGYTFASRFRSRSGRTTQQQDAAKEDDKDRKSRPSVSWAKNSQSFYASRRDSRGVKELWVINSLANPRPTLEKYSYPMPGEDQIRKSELHVFDRQKKSLVKIAPKWKDESYSNTYWRGDSGVLQFIRRDRLARNVEVCTFDMKTGKTECLISEGFDAANIAPQSARRLEDTGEMIWWSERTGWGHFYLYDKDGEFKNAITTGQFRASRIVAVDEEKRLLYFRGNGREPGENIYLQHLYRVHLDGSGLKLMDPGDANHSSTLSPTKNFLVDNCSKTDMRPRSVLRDANGEELMVLEQADLSRLEEIGWRMPETFVVKAADGVTDLYGNMWKPFDFDPKKKYPVIAHVYPGPQTEGTRHTFSATAGEQQLAQLGFIVIQVGHRGGTPTRSKAYASYGYFNLRDYGLADKKAAIEQLAQQFGYVDVTRVGIYGHSGGGFMTAAAMLREPYNEFFKVGVSTAGNHDNNIYNYSWSERYHGLKEVEVKEDEKKSTADKSSDSSQNRQTQRTGAFDVEASDYFYEYEAVDWDDPEALDRWANQEWWSAEPRFQDEDDDDRKKQKEQRKKRREQKKADQRAKAKNAKQGDMNEKKDGDKNVADTKGEKKDADKKAGDAKDADKKKGDGKDDAKKDGDGKDGGKKEADAKKTRFEIEVPTNAELAGNLKGHLFLIHGELDNNVHPANTLRLVDALIKADKRFDMLYLPATRHGFGSYQPYVTQRMYEYFAEHLLDDYQSGADIGEKQTADD